MNGRYKLWGRIPVPVEDLMEWANWFGSADRKVARTVIDDECHVSTVFLALDHNFLGSGPPVLFETMVFGGKLDKQMERYSTWEEAEAGHRRWVNKLTKKIRAV